MKVYLSHIEILEKRRNAPGQFFASPSGQGSRMPQPSLAASLHPIAKRKEPDNCTTSSRVILTGIVNLLEGQRRFAEELGLPFERVFDPECQVFRNEQPERILRAWLKDKIDGPNKFKCLVNDLIEHNLALWAALDGVAQESLSCLDPKTVKARSFSLFGWRPFAWLTFRRLHRALTTNDYLRQQELVVKGFARSYCTHRATLRTSKAHGSDISNSQTDKDES